MPTTSFSLEIVPPSRPEAISAYQEMLVELPALAPESVAVTLGAGQAETTKEASLTALGIIQNQLMLPAVAHLPGLYETKASISQFLDELASRRVTKVMALRGEVQPEKAIGDFPHASDLANFINRFGSFDIVGASYPARHPESSSWVAELLGLQHKVDAGMSQLITQVFFDNQIYDNFIHRIRQAGINIPVTVGVMPLLSQHLVDNLTHNMGIPLSHRVNQLITKYGNDPQAFRQAGIQYAIDQINELLAMGVEGIHLFTMNDADATKQIKSATFG
ncbi:methylenetetrahydrofolate reductase [Levilactobacillus bambusae]|uniref:Methylenetetrahydrofolate reductase n=1 Tax=Levilactobacillus bambusae TaxID=2024736 RepID=A0A2V1MYZ8_9LACO|nr:methylenetetrahydrofolate reductase [Levilactobacillus bambusae]PWG00199.1 methylenetetrahydrofolate reductase [NAD(P)H] [Levilactobacillus bambusae]